MYKTTVISLVAFLFAATAQGQNSYRVFINEIRANDASTDDIEFVELVGPAGTTITGLILRHFNGSASSDGGIWSHTIGTFTLPDDGVVDENGAALGYYVLGDATVPNLDESIPGDIQNGPDGIILYDTDGTTILDAVAWEGEGDLTDDDPGTVTTAGSTSADNYLHVTVDDDSGDNSLQAPDSVFDDDGSGWSNAAATPGAINTTQTNMSVALPVELDSFSIE